MKKHPFLTALAETAVIGGGLMLIWWLSVVLWAAER